MYAYVCVSVCESESESEGGICTKVKRNEVLSKKNKCGCIVWRREKEKGGLDNDLN